ncbi:MAG: type I secretion system permease/ATPase [Paracoccaceae bacterium]|jgi:ATP-binding cassette subfamily C protein|nr:type I secretion system permease/ATPase [Paracoccaceae bacterium]
MREKTSLDLAYRKYRSAFAATLVFSFCTNLLMFVGPIYMLQIYDRVLASRNETTLIMLTVIAVALLVSYGLLEFTRSKLLVRAGLQFDEVLANPVFHRAVKQQAAVPNSAAHVALQDIDKVREFITGQGVLAFFDAPWVPLFLALCFAFHPWLGIVATIGALVIFALALVNEFSTRGSLSEAGRASQGASHFASTALQNAEVIRAMGMERALSTRWRKQHDEMLDNQATASARAGGVVATSKFVRMSMQIAILGVGAFLAIQQQISPGIMIAASIVMGRAVAPVEQAVGQWKHFVAMRNAHTRLRQLFAAIAEDPERVALPAPRGALTVEQVVAVAPGTRETILRNVSFGIEAGEVLAIIGPSGSGKTTLVRHLVGASQPATGAVRLDGTELDHWDPEQLGRHVGYLPQDVKLFRGTVGENISRFQDDGKDDEIVSAATLSGAHDMIQKLAEGYNTDVGDGGNVLSGGQRQRVGLARAVFREPSLVILDEPNSNLDSYGEQALMNCVKTLKGKGKTVVLVTHKTSLLALSDKTLMLVDGRVEKFGPTKEMFKPQGQGEAVRADGQKPSVVALNPSAPG